MSLILVSFLAGILTILAPCILPLLPIILGASVQDAENKKRPYIIIGSLAVSIIIFSLLLKASTLLIDIPQDFWKYFSATIVIAFGVITLFPDLWKAVATKLGLSDKSNQNLAKQSQKEWNLGAILVGFSLGPIFASCSPTYLLILSVILPAGIVFGLINLSAYVLGLSLILLAIALLWQRFTAKLRGLSDPKGWFKKSLWVLFILVGLGIAFGLDKQIEASLIKAGFFDVTVIEQSILDRVEKE